MKRLLDDAIAPDLAALLRSAETDTRESDRAREDRIIAAIAAATPVAGASVASPHVVRRLARVAKWAAPAIGAVLIGAFVATSESTRSSAPTAPKSPRTSAEPTAPPADTPESPVGVRVEDLPSAGPVRSASPPVASARTTTKVEDEPAPSPPAAPSIDSELAAIDAARAAVASGQASEALARVTSYRATFTTPHFADEADALEVQALALAGRSELARQKAETFLARHPKSPYAQRVRSAVAPKD
jgi:hypothetical protein